MRRVAWERAVGAGLGLVLGCSGSGAFLCESDEACRQEGVHGLCQPSGYCSFPDGACPSGQRYGGYASSSLAGACVEPEPLAETTGSSGHDTEPGPLTTATSTTSPATGVDGPVTTEPVGDSGTGPTTSAGEVGEEATGTTGAPAEICWLDDFDDDVVDPAVWCAYAEPGIAFDETRGHLRFSFLPDEWPLDDDGSGWATTCEQFPLLGAIVGTELASVPQVSPHTESYIELGHDGRRLGLGVLGGELYAFVWSGTSYSGVDYQPYDPVEHRFLRLSGTEEGLVAEASADAETWEHVYTEATDLSGTDGYATLGVWAEMLPHDRDEARFELFGACWLEG